MTNSWEQPEAYDRAVVVQSGGKDMEETTLNGGNLGDARSTSSKESSCDPCKDGKDVEFRIAMHQKFIRLQAEAEGTTNREQRLWEQLYETRAKVIEKEIEVCNLQAQLAEELALQQKLLIDGNERDNEIHHLLASSALSRQVSDVGQNCNASKTGAESHSCSKARNSNVAPCVRQFSSPSAVGSESPSPGARSLILQPCSPQITVRGASQPKQPFPQTSFRRGAETETNLPMLAHRSTRASLAPSFKLQASKTSAGMVASYSSDNVSAKAWVPTSAMSARQDKMCSPQIAARAVQSARINFLRGRETTPNTPIVQGRPVLASPSTRCRTVWRLGQ